MRGTAGAETRPPDRNPYLHLGGQESSPAAQTVVSLERIAIRNAAGAETRPPPFRMREGIGGCRP